MTERIQLLDDLGAEFARVTAEAEMTTRQPAGVAGRLSRAGLGARRFAIALTITVLVGGGAYAVPTTRAAVDGITDSFAAWVSGDSDDAPGRALGPGDDVPSWFNASGEARLIAKTEGVGLYVRRADSDNGPVLEFGLGEGVGIAVSDTLEGWRRQLGQHAVVVLGSALVGPRDVLDERGRSPLLGVTAPDVERIELRYFDGPSLVSTVGDGGFVLMTDAWRRQRELIGYDGAGRVLERADLSNFDSRYLCEKEPEVCPPEGSSSNR